MDSKEQIETRLSFLKRLFGKKYKDQKWFNLDEQIKHSEETPSYNILHLEICEPEEGKTDWVVLHWAAIPATRWSPPDAFESEVGTYKNFNEAVEAVWSVLAKEEFEAICTNIGEEDFAREEAEWEAKHPPCSHCGDRSGYSNSDCPNCGAIIKVDKS